MAKVSQTSFVNSTPVIFSEYESFLTLSSLSTFNFYKSKADFYYNLNVAIHNHTFNAVLLQQTLLEKTPYLVDACTLTNEANSVFYTFNCFYSNRYTNFQFVGIKKTFTSISTIFRGAVWVERELREFSSLYIRGLLDSRRLLTDYTVIQNKNTTLYYDLIAQEVF